jgi:hypothetical protein
MYNKFVLWSTLTHDENEKNIVCLKEDEQKLIDEGKLTLPLFKTVTVWYDKDLRTTEKYAGDFNHPV